eukprot:536205_1
MSDLENISSETSEGDEIANREDPGCRSSRSARMGATINLLLTAMGGGGMFANVYGCSQLGIIGFILVTLWSMILTFFTIQFLCISSKMSNTYSCYTLSYQYLGGKKGEILTKIFITFGNWCYIVNIIQIFADFIDQCLLADWSESSNGFWTSREFVCILGLMLIYPFIMVKTIRNLEHLSSILLFFAFCVLLIVIINASHAVLFNKISTSIQWFPTNYNSLFSGLPPITWSWAVQFNIMPVYMSLNSLTRSKQLKKVSYWVISLLFIYYIIFGISTMIIWGDNINDDFITNLDYNNSNYVFYYGFELATVTQFFLCLITFASIPIFAFESRKNLHYILMDIYYYWLFVCIDRNNQIDMENNNQNIDNETTPLIHANDNETTHMHMNTVMDYNYEETSTSIWIEGSFLIVSAAGVALFLTNLNWSLTLVGSTYGSYIVYFIPSVIYCMAIRNSRILTVKHKFFMFMAFLIFIYGIVVCGMGLTAAFI